MSGQISSPWLSQNELYYPRFANQQLAEGDQKLAQNQLLQQSTQQEIGGRDIEIGARLASSLLNMDEGQAAQAYSQALPGLQAQGYLRHAPSVYPGHEVAKRLAAMGTPSKDQYLQAQSTAAKAGMVASDGTTAGTGGKPLAPVDTGDIEPEAQTRAFAVRDGLIKRGLDPETATAFAANALHESGANPGTGAGDGGASHGLFQWRDDRRDNYVKTYGHAPDNAPLDEQLDFVMRELGGPESVAKSRILGAKGVAEKAGQVSEAYLRPKDTAAEMNRRAGTALKLAGLNTPPAPDAQAGMTDQAWLDQQAKTYPSLAGPNVNQQAGTQPPATPGGPPTPAPYQVASLTPTPPPSPTAPAAATPVGTDGLVRNQDGSVGTPNAGGLAAPAPAPASAPAPAPSALPDLPAPPAAPKIGPSGYTTEQLAAQRRSANDPTVSADEFRKMQAAQQSANAAATEKAYADQVTYVRELRERQSAAEQSSQRTATLKNQAESAQRDLERLDLERKRYASEQSTRNLPAGQERDASGTARDIPGARQPPPPGYRYTADGGQEIIPGGPADPVTMEAQAKAKGQGGRQMPPTERDKLVKSAGQIDEMGLLANNFRDYGGYWTSSIGDMSNYIARNTPGDSPRAEWWQEYQRQKLAARQAISGQSLTSSEQTQYERADINPGMNNDLIRKNLALQQRILTRARDRTVLSLIKDGYNSGAVEEAAAVRAEEAQSRMSSDVITGGTKSATAGGGWSVKRID